MKFQKNDGGEIREFDTADEAEELINLLGFPDNLNNSQNSNESTSSRMSSRSNKGHTTKFDSFVKPNVTKRVTKRKTSEISKPKQNPKTILTQSSPKSKVISSQKTKVTPPKSPSASSSSQHSSTSNKNVNLGESNNDSLANLVYDLREDPSHQLDNETFVRYVVLRDKQFKTFLSQLVTIFDIFLIIFCKI